MATSFKKKVFLFIFCLASITQGMYSTYFVSILTTIETIYQIQSKTAGALLSASEIGSTLGALFIAYYGGRGNKPKWIAACMTISALAALISISPHFLLISSNSPARNPKLMTTSSSTIDLESTNSSSSHINQLSPVHQLKDLTGSSDNVEQGKLLNNYSQTIAASTKPPLNSDYLCRLENVSTEAHNLTMRDHTKLDPIAPASFQNHLRTREYLIPVSIVIVIFFICLLAIGFGSTAITTLGIPFIDDIISKEESPLYLGLTIGLKIFGPALGFLLGSFCVRLDVHGDWFASVQSSHTGEISHYVSSSSGAWWLGVIMISVPLLILAIPMCILSGHISEREKEHDDFEDITYQAAEDHDIGGSNDLPPHMLALTNDMDITSNRTCFSSEVDLSSKEVLQGFIKKSCLDQDAYSRYVRNITLAEPSASVDKQKLSALPLPTSMIKAPDQISKNNHHTTVWNYDLGIASSRPGGLESTSSTDTVLHRIQTCVSDFQTTPFMVHQPQRPPPPSSSRSSMASSMRSYSDDVNIDGKVERRRIRNGRPFALNGLSNSLSRLLRNRLLVLRIVSGILHILPIAGFYTFLPKYLTEQFLVSQSSASAISALAGILFVGLGAFLGGTIVRLFNVNSRMMTRWIAMSALLYAIGMIILMNLGCNNNRIVHYESEAILEPGCPTSCRCSKTVYNPVCANGTTYISPCLAGCMRVTLSADNLIYNDCGCSSQILSAGVSSNHSLTKTEASENNIDLNVATKGHCSIDCQNLTLYVIVFSAFTLIHASCEVGSMMFNLRCVKSNDRTLALGLITFASSLLGQIPCSVIYGSIVDLTCVHWDSLEQDSAKFDGNKTSDYRGACRVYDNDSFRYYLHGITALAMFFAFIIDSITSRFANEVDFYDRSDSKADIRLGLKKSTETI